MTEPRIGTDSIVTLHFAVGLAGGEQVDSTFDRQPATFKMGDGSLLPGFEQAIVGLKAGERKVLEIAPEQGFGAHNPNNVQQLPRSQFETIELSEGLIVMFSDAANGELPGTIRAFDDQQVTVDFNHPLAGKPLTFEVEIIDIRAA